MKKIIQILLPLCFMMASKAYATCSNYVSYADGQVLTAASLNSLQTNYTNCVNAVLDGDNFTGTVNLYSGADINFYSDTGSTLKAQIDGATGDVIMSPRILGTAVNCEINYSAGTITISGRGGTALSATSPCHIGIRSNSNGIIVTATFTSNVTATDGAASQTDGNLFGITDANWANAMPLFFGIIYNGTTPYFTLSRKPHAISGAAAGNLCQLGDTDCDGENDVMVLTTGLALASWVDLPITQVAWLQGTYATAGGAWSFSESAYTGFNYLYENQRWTMPYAQNGAAASTFFQDNGGSAMAFNTNNYTYYIDRNGIVTVYVELVDDSGALDGVGAVQTIMAIPYSHTAANDYSTVGGLAYITEVTNGSHFAQIQHNAGTAGVVFRESAGTVAQNGDFGNGARTIRGSFSFRSL